MPLVINVLGGRDTHTKTHTHTDVQTKMISRNQRPCTLGLKAQAWLNKNNPLINEVTVIDTELCYKIQNGCF